MVGATSSSEEDEGDQPRMGRPLGARGLVGTYSWHTEDEENGASSLRGVEDIIRFQVRLT